MVIIWKKKHDKLEESLMLYIPNLVALCPLVPEKKTFEGFLPYMGVATIMVMWLKCCKPPFFRCHLKFSFDRPSYLREEDLWKWFTMDVRTDGRQSMGINKNIIMSSFKSCWYIQKKEGGPDNCFG